MSVPVHLLHKGRFLELPAAEAERVAANAWEIRIPADDPIHGKTRRTPTAEAWDEAIFLVDGDETQPAIGSGESASSVRVSVVIL